MVECDLAKVEVAGSNPVSRSNIESAGSPAPRLALCTPRRFVAGSVPVAQLNYSALWIVSGWRAVPSRDCALRSVGPNAHSAPRAAVTWGPLHPAWFSALRRRVAAGSVPVARLSYSTLSILLGWRAESSTVGSWPCEIKTGLDRIGPPL